MEHQSLDTQDLDVKLKTKGMFVLGIFVKEWSILMGMIERIVRTYGSVKDKTTSIKDFEDNWYKK